MPCSAHEKVIVALHHPLVEGSAPSTHLLWNHAEVTDFLVASTAVVVVFSGRSSMAFRYHSLCTCLDLHLQIRLVHCLCRTGMSSQGESLCYVEIASRRSMERGCERYVGAASEVQFCVPSRASGHYHVGGYKQMGTTHFVVQESILEAPSDVATHAVVDVYPTRLHIVGSGIVTSRSLTI